MRGYDDATNKLLFRALHHLQWCVGEWMARVLNDADMSPLLVPFSDVLAWAAAAEEVLKEHGGGHGELLEKDQEGEWESQHATHPSTCSDKARYSSKYGGRGEAQAR